jgi:hypothetical protein
MFHYIFYGYHQPWRPGERPDRVLNTVIKPMTGPTAPPYMNIESPPVARGMGMRSAASGSGNSHVDHTGYDDIGKKPDTPTQKKY